MNDWVSGAGAREVRILTASVKRNTKHRSTNNEKFYIIRKKI